MVSLLPILIDDINDQSKCLYMDLFHFSSDPAMKQFLLHLDETGGLGTSFVLADLDDYHLFISAEIIPILKSRIDDLMDKLSFPITKQD